MRDVADALGVSQATVSNAFRHPDQLSAGLREQILRTASELGYSGPDPLASRLRAGSTGAMGLIVNKPLRYIFEDPAARLTLTGVATACGDFGLSLVLVPELGSGRTEVIETSLVDGFVAFSDPLEPERVAAIERRNLRAVGLDAPIGDSPAWVGVDDRAGARLAARTVAAHGHTRVGIITFPLRTDSSPGLVQDGVFAEVDFRAGRARLDGYRRGLGPDIASGALVVGAAGVTEADGAAAARVLLGHARPPTAILAMSDRLAVGALSAAAELGLQVPTALSVVGFDDVPVAAERQLTTVHQPHERKGLAAVQMLLAPDPAARPRRLGVRLVERASLAAAPHARRSRRPDR